MRKARRFWMVLVLTFAMLLPTLTACSDSGDPQSGSITLAVIGEDGTETEYVLSLDGVDTSRGLLGVLEKGKAEGKVDYTADDTGYGAFLTSIGGLSQDAARGVYLLLYTSVERDFDVSVYATEITYRGKTLCSAGVGISAMTVEDGMTVVVKPGNY